MTRRSAFFSRTAYIYLLLPFFCFLFGWIKLGIAIPIALLIAYPLYILFKRAPSLWVPDFRDKKTWLYLVAFVLIVTLWVYLSGIGGLSFQNYDHNGRNGVFEALVQRKWPVTFASSKGAPLVYYFGFWLPSAVFGKIWNVHQGFHFQVIWAVGGILLTYYFISAHRKKLQIWPLIIFIFFSGADILEKIVTLQDLFQINLTTQLEWTVPFQYSSQTTQLFWVFNQAIPAWLILTFMLNLRNNQQLVVLLGVSILFGPLPFVGVLPFAIYWGCRNANFSIMHVTWNNFKVLVSSFISWENVLLGGITGVLSYLFISSNRAANHILLKMPDSSQKWWNYLAFITCEVLILMIPIWRLNKTKVEYYITLLILLLFPFIYVGFGGDFTMRASIPALVMLYILIIDTLTESSKANNQRLLVTLTVVLMIGAITPAHEFMRALNYDRNRIVAQANHHYFADNQRHIEYAFPINKEPTYAVNILGNKNSLFFKYLAKN